MLADIEAGKVGTVIVKDMSRFMAVSWTRTRTISLPRKQRDCSQQSCDAARGYVVRDKYVSHIHKSHEEIVNSF